MLSLTRDIRSVLDEGRQAYVAIVTKDGPHVTPELYAVAGDQLWFLVAATTLKAREIPNNTRVSGLVRVGGRSVLLSGTADVYDVRSPADIGRAVSDPTVAKALTGFLLRNAGDLAAFGKDLLSGRLGRKVPPRRVLIRLRPTRAALFDGTSLVSRAGDWPGSVTGAGKAETLRGSRDAAVGWLGPDGPVALPARLDEECAYVPAVAAALAGLPKEAPACVVTDDYGRPGPAAKSGTLLRGTGRLDEDGRASIDVAKTTEWDGIKATTTKA
ncbi:MAG TPA: pyridoxamine 5'-phosphate oxidase family protein [Frankiaceae bacterium]|jgi:hypothetical protein|nr:pyridoxamine 5'-phosphate oxidase family protein [Frankiaceae bacterium]